MHMRGQSLTFAWYLAQERGELIWSVQNALDCLALEIGNAPTLFPISTVAKIYSEIVTIYF